MTTTADHVQKQSTLQEDSPVMVFSSDNHVGPRMRDLRPYCPEKYLSDFDEFAASEYADPVKNIPMAEPWCSNEYNAQRRNNLQTTGHYDPHAFLRDMDRDGVSGAVIFHQSLNGEVFPFDLTNSFGQGIPAPEAKELAGVGRVIYNRWLADFCSVESVRTVGLAQLPFWDIDAAIAELEWCADHGLRGVNFPAPGQPGMVQPEDPDFDRFYDVAAALDMSLATHIGGGPPPVEGSRELRLGEGMDDLSYGLVESIDWGLRTIYRLVLSGAFERHPNLKIIITELPGAYWNEIANRMDSVHYTPVRSRKHKLSRPPSEYLATNVWMGSSFQSRDEAIAAIEIGREDRFLWGSDYPHPEGSYRYEEDPNMYPMTRLSLANTYHDLPIDKVRKMAGENAIDAYPRLDGKELSKVAQRVGIRSSEIAIAPDLSEYPYIKETATLAFRTLGWWS